MRVHIWVFPVVWSFLSNGFSPDISVTKPDIFLTFNLFSMFYFRSTKSKYAVLAREMAPGAATEDMFVGGAADSREGKL